MWINVLERTPKNKKDVWVYNKKKKTIQVDYYINSDGGGWAKSYQNEISHWMPYETFNDLFRKGLLRKPNSDE